MKYKRAYYDNALERAAKAESHTHAVEMAYEEEIESATAKSIIYDTDFKCDIVCEKDMKISVEALDSVSAIMKYAGKGRVAVLNFSSYKHPGGGFINGTKAQEECLCHESCLYNVLSRLPQFYKTNIKDTNKGLYLDRGIYTPGVVFMKDEQSVLCDVITCAAPNKAAAQTHGVTDEENLNALCSRIRFLLDIAKENHVDTLILGAYGCGVFGQYPEEVSMVFKEFLSSTHKCFDEVIFAIPQGRDGNLKAFKKMFDI